MKNFNKQKLEETIQSKNTYIKSIKEFNMGELKIKRQLYKMRESFDSSILSAKVRQKHSSKSRQNPLDVRRMSSNLLGNNVNPQKQNTYSGYIDPYEMSTFKQKIPNQLYQKPKKQRSMKSIDIKKPSSMSLTQENPQKVEVIRLNRRASIYQIKPDTKNLNQTMNYE